MYGYFSASKKSAERRWLSRISVRVSTLATSIWSWPVILVASSSGPSKLPSNLLNWPLTVDTARCLAVIPTVVCALSTSYLTIWSSWNFLAERFRRYKESTCLRKQLFQGGQGGGRLALLQAEPERGRPQHRGRAGLAAWLRPGQLPGRAEALAQLGFADSRRDRWERSRESHHEQHRSGGRERRHPFGVASSLGGP